MPICPNLRFEKKNKYLLFEIKRGDLIYKKKKKIK